MGPSVLAGAIAFAIVGLAYSETLTSDCGRSHITTYAQNTTDWRIVGGHNAKFGQWPWQIILIHEIRLGMTIERYQCGGTVVAKNWILTAAHCVADSDRNLGNYKIILAAHDQTKVESQKLAANIEKILIHKYYDDELNHNDIALIKIKGEIDFHGKHKQVQPVCITNDETKFSHSECYATGWGSRYKDDRGTVHVLQEVKVPLVSAHYCKKFFGNLNTQSNVCAGGYSQGGFGTCTGDSGGPIQCRGKDGAWYQVGITSYGAPCAQPEVPDVYSKVSYFYSWIKNVIHNY